MWKIFNFNDVVDLYKAWKSEEGCELLYENIWVFIVSCKSIYVLPDDRMNIMSEAILEAHISILKSLDKDYWQIYNYVKIRVVGRIKNYYIRLYKIFNDYYTLDDELLECNPADEVNLNVSDETILKFIIEWILSLSKSEREVIYLRVFNFPDKTLKEISEISWMSKSMLSRKYISAVNKIKEHLNINWFNHEDLF